MKRKEFAVIGLGRFGKSLATALASSGAQVLVLDKDEEALQEVSDIVTHTICGDATNANTIYDLGLSNYDGVIIAMSSNLEANVMATILVKESGVPFVLVKAKTELEGKVLKKIGADKIIYPEKETGMRLANYLMHDNYLEMVALSEEYSIVDVDIPHDWIGKTLKKLDIRASYGV
ncbi:MAG: TrkA family potassium uptake protein, partial [Lachnospiraceae bacterium]|nr:TrkA family potassium uptake protein [Lachnospiraceae bacterium]